jgi:predicted permease
VFATFLKIFAIFLMIAAGFLVRRVRMVDDPFNRQLSLLLTHVFYPALIVSAVVRNYTLASLAANWTLPAGSALIMVAGWAVGRLALRGLAREPEGLRRTFHYQCTMNNYSFLPIMLVSGLFGGKAVAQVVFASLGAELCFWTLGIQALTGHTQPRQVLRNLLTTPMGALAAAIAVLVLGAALPPAAALPAGVRLTGGMLLDTCQWIGQATIPVSAVVCGCRMATIEARHLLSRPMLAMLGLRLGLIPALAVLGLALLPLPADARPVLLVVAVQPAAMASVTMAEIYRTDAHFAAASVLLTHAACLLTIPLWLHVLGV